MSLQEEASKKLKEVDEQMVSVSQADFKGLMATITKLQQDIDISKGGSIQIPSVKVRKARVHFYKGQPIVNVGQAWEIDDKFGNPEMRLEIYTDKKYEVNYRDFMESSEKQGFTSEELVIKEIKVVDSGEQDMGWVDKVEVEYDSYRSKSVGKVPLKVVVPEYVYVMELNNEETVEINPLALN